MVVPDTSPKQRASMRWPEPAPGAWELLVDLVKLICELQFEQTSILGSLHYCGACGWWNCQPSCSAEDFDANCSKTRGQECNVECCPAKGGYDEALYVFPVVASLNQEAQRDNWDVMKQFLRLRL